jgi:hypothetical protein
MKIKKNGKVINLTESDLKRIVKEQGKQSLKMQGVDADDSHDERIAELEFRVKEIEKKLKIQ